MAKLRQIDLCAGRLDSYGAESIVRNDFQILARRLFLHGLRERSGIPLDDGYVRVGPPSREAAHRLTAELLDLAEPPTAVFAASDLQAFGVVEAARERGLDVPGDLSVMGFDDIDVSPYLGLTTVRQPLFESGRRAAEMLLSLLSGDTEIADSVDELNQIVRRGVFDFGEAFGGYEAFELKE